MVNKQLKLIILSFSGILLFQNLVAQNTELNQLIQVAVSQNPDLLWAEKNTIMQKTLVNTAFDLPKAPLELQVGNIQNPFIRDYSLGFSQSFELPIVYKNRKQYLESLVNTSESQALVIKRQLRLEIRMLYSDLSAIQSKSNLMVQELEKLKELGRIYQQKFEQGEADQSDYLNIRLKENELNRELSNLEREKKNQELKLMQILNQKSLPILTYSLPWSFLDISRLSIDQNPLRMLNNNLIDNASKEETTILDQKKPTMNAGLLNQSMQGSLRQFVGIIGMEIPISTKANSARQQAAKIRVQMAEQQRDKFDFQIKSELSNFQSQLELIENQLTSIKNLSLPDAEKTLAILQLKYIEGQVEYSDWYIVFAQYLSFKNTLIELENEKNITISKIYYISENE